MPNTATRTPHTSTTWASIDNHLTPEKNLGWMVMSDLEHELAGKSALSIETARNLIFAADSGLPIVLAWERRIEEQIERTETTVVVEYIYGPVGNQPGRARVRYCGFAHYLYLDTIVEAVIPKTKTTYRKA